MDSIEKSLLAYGNLEYELGKGNGFACVAKDSTGTIKFFQHDRVWEDANGNIIFFKKK